MTLRMTLAAACSAMFMANAGTAATLSYSDTLAVQTTNYAGVAVAVSGFDPSLGTLNSVAFTLDGLVRGNASGESLDASATRILLKLSAEIAAATASLPNLAVVLPVVNSTFNARAFDGVINFAGPSGVAFTGLSATDSKSVTLTGADMADFIGVGSVSVLLSADGESVGTGAGNLITQFSTGAGASVTVVYDFEPATVTPPAEIPLPAGLPLMATALCALALLRRRKG